MELQPTTCTAIIKYVQCRTSKQLTFNVVMLNRHSIASSNMDSSSTLLHCTSASNHYML